MANREVPMQRMRPFAKLVKAFSAAAWCAGVDQFDDGAIGGLCAQC